MRSRTPAPSSQRHFRSRLVSPSSRLKARYDMRISPQRTQRTRREDRLRFLTAAFHSAISSACSAFSAVKSADTPGSSATARPASRTHSIGGAARRGTARRCGRRPRTRSGSRRAGPTRRRSRGWCDRAIRSPASAQLRSRARSRSHSAAFRRLARTAGMQLRAEAALRPRRCSRRPRRPSDRAESP